MYKFSQGDIVEFNPELDVRHIGPGEYRISITVFNGENYETISENVSQNTLISMERMSKNCTLEVKSVHRASGAILVGDTNDFIPHVLPKEFFIKVEEDENASKDVNDLLFNG